tara:strand:+ start:458 stop:625 length:168 start_codon:yes stop_codon:yes gene_type:complete
VQICGCFEKVFGLGGSDVLKWGAEQYNNCIRIIKIGLSGLLSKGVLPQDIAFLKI